MNNISKDYSHHSALLRLITILLIFAVAFISQVFTLYAHATAQSRLASGVWVRCSLSSEGVHFISHKTLRSLGFSEPEKVHVFGFGGKLISENLSDDFPDDLPPIRTFPTKEGIIFYGVSSTEWEESDDWLMRYTHISNPYTDKSYYFLSDIPIEPEIENNTLCDDIETENLPEITTFTQSLIHENDLLRPAQTGRMILGEDFRGKPVRTFSFDLPGNVGDASVRVGFGTKVTNGSAALMFKANGHQLSATTSDRIPPVTSSETFIVPTTTSKSVSQPGSKLDLEITFSHSGNLVTAALDFIEVEYQRELRLKDGQLVFRTDNTETSVVAIEGASAETIVWDVTDHIRVQSVSSKHKDSILIFTVPPGNHRFAVFNPDGVKLIPQIENRVENQDLHSMTIPDLLIVSPEPFLSYAVELAQFRQQHDGLNVAVVTPQQIYNEFSSGTPDLSAFRQLLRFWLNCGTGSVPSVLLFGRSSNDPKGKVSHGTDRSLEVPVWQSPHGFSLSTSYSTDDFIAMLDAGPFNPATATIHAPVGRLPIRSAEEAAAMIKKIIGYSSTQDLDSWRNNLLIVADDGDDGEHLLQAEQMVNAIRENEEGEKFELDKLYLDTYPLVMGATGLTYPQATKDLLSKWNQGTSLISYIGHANSREWGHEKLLSATDIAALDNRRLPFLYAATCDFMAWDHDETSGAESLWLKPNGGIIGALCPSRKVFIPMNAAINTSFGSNLFKRDYNNRRLTIGEIVRQTKNSVSGDNKLRFALLCDPTLRLPAPTREIVFDSIGGRALQPENPPVIQAGEIISIKGRIVKPDGMTDETFNGPLTIHIFDAERATQSLGNGETGKVVTFNDRGPRILRLNTTSKAGLWEVKTHVPSVISQNFNNALLTGYAHDSLRNEAHGASSGFILYGTSSADSDDNEGPEIRDFYINGPLFTDGGTTGPAIKIHAFISDESGINISETDSGHELSVTLDREVFYSLGDCFEPDPDNFTSGHLNCELKNLLPGRHTLTLDVWDNCGNHSSSELSFQVKAAWYPSITKVAALTAAGESETEFLVETDGIDDDAACEIDLFSLTGFHIATLKADKNSRKLQTIVIPWNQKDRSGRRVSGGIYPYRVMVIDSKGRVFTKSSKFAVSGT